MINKLNISSRVIKLEKLINTEDYSITQLKNFFTNAINSQTITDIEKELLINAVTKKIRIKFPKNAKKILGGKSKEAQELLEETYNTLEKEFDWSKNKVKNGVKVGGDMISGRQYISWYMSYKNDQKYATTLHYGQKSSEDEPFLNVDYRRIGKDYEKDKETKIFPVELKDDAVNLFRNFLIKTII
jgi:hypothetical protein